MPKVDLTWTEKYATFEQSTDGRLTSTDFSFLAEICYREVAQIEHLTASLLSGQADHVLATYASSDPRTHTNGYFYTRKSRSYDSLADLEAAHPPAAEYCWLFDDGRDRLRLAPVRIGGPEARTAIPEPSPIFLSQDGGPIDDPDRVRPDRPLTIAWRPFVIGATRAGTSWQDLVFVLVSDADGEVVFTGGAPGSEAGFLDFTKTSTEVPGATLEAGGDYVVFVSQVKYVDHNLSNGIEQLAANSFATELRIRTVGDARPRTAPIRRAPYLWCGKTPRDRGMVPWPGFIYSRSM